MATSPDTNPPRSGGPTDAQKDFAAVPEERDAERAVAEFSAEFARRVGALADLFENWRKPRVARAVIDSVIAGDAEAFRRLSDSLKWEPPPTGGIPPQLDKCFWLRSLIETIAESRKETVCRLPPEFSPGQRGLYASILLTAYRNGWAVILGPPGLTADKGRQVVGGPEFLAALNRAGLVTCNEEPIEDGGLSVVLGPPSRVCV
jgi:hypothetical protein